MAKMYTQRTAALRAVTIDSNIIDAQKLLIYPGEGDKNERINVAEKLSELGEKNYAYTDAENTFSGANTFNDQITVNNNILISDGVLTFEDTIDGTVADTINPNVSGYRYITGIPGSFDNGVCYDIGEISDLTDLSSVRFSAEGRLVQTCELWFTTSATPPTKHKWPTGIYWIDSATGAAPTLIASKNYRLVFRQEPNKIIASIAYLY
jgi:hypothetical protein